MMDFATVVTQAHGDLSWRRYEKTLCYQQPVPSALRRCPRTHQPQEANGLAARDGAVGSEWRACRWGRLGQGVLSPRWCADPGVIRLAMTFGGVSPNRQKFPPFAVRRSHAFQCTQPERTPRSSSWPQRFGILNTVAGPCRWVCGQLEASSDAWRPICLGMCQRAVFLAPRRLAHVLDPGKLRRVNRRSVQAL
jgi:hypothetical protein